MLKQIIERNEKYDKEDAERRVKWEADQRLSKLIAITLIIVLIFMIGFVVGYAIAYKAVVDSVVQVVGPWIKVYI